MNSFAGADKPGKCSRLCCVKSYEDRVAVSRTHKWKRSRVSVLVRSRLIKLNGDSDYVEPEAVKVISER